jgi:hypothetical protein
MSAVPSVPFRSSHPPQELITFLPLVVEQKERTIGELSALFEQYGLRGLAPQTLTTYKAYLLPFAEHFRDYTPQTLPPLQVVEWFNNKAEGWKSPSTVATALRCIKRLFCWSIKFELAKRNPLRAIPTPTYRPRREWTRREFVVITRHSHAALRRVMYFMAWTGAATRMTRLRRFGKCSAITPSDSIRDCSKASGRVGSMPSMHRQRCNRQLARN